MLGQPARGQIGDRLGGAEGDDEGQDRRGRADVEVLPANQRQHAPLEPDHAADERVQCNEQRELRCVRTQAELYRGHASAPSRPARFAATIRSCSSGAGGISASNASAKASASARASKELWARSKPIEETGLPERLRPQTEPA